MNEQSKEKGSRPDASAEIDQVKLQRFMQGLKDEQNLSLGFFGGLVAAIIGAIIWGIITYVTNFQIGWMAVGVGFLVGIGVRLFGKGLDTIFGIFGAVLALFGCLAGNLLSVCIVVSRHHAMPLLDILSQLNPTIAVELMKATFSPIDLLFYAIAVYEGYRFSFRRLKEEEVAAFAKP
ncbi:MAG: hypothetical protein JXA50_06165 [Deltaproteobacteria bacterium]|nr:hypothetical protein [Deltaproteobacteria bacterium]